MHIHQFFINMKHKILLSLVAVILTALSAHAYDFRSGDLYYSYTGSNTVEVTCQSESSDSNYVGLTYFMIPSSITYQGTTYSVTSIGDSAFLGCSTLTSITIPNSVTNIGEWAFGYCSGLTSIIIPNSLTSIGKDAFRSCSSLVSIVVENGNPVYDSRNNCNAIIETATNSLIAGCSSTIIPNSVTGIGESAFFGCSNLTTITIPNSVTSLGDGPFSGCINLTSIIVENGNPIFDSRNNCNAIIETASNTLITGCAATVIPNSVTHIGDWAFGGQKDLTSITISDSIISIGEGAFYGCSGLTSVTIGNSVTSIGEGAFYGCSGLTSVTIGNSVTNIGDYAFNRCTNLSSVTIPNSVTSLGIYSFCYSTNLTYITIPNSVTSIGEGAFLGCSGLTSVTIGNSVTNIGKGAFHSCSSLTSVTIPNSVTNIGEGAFEDCTGLTSVTIPNSVTNIGDYLFYGCSNLTSVNIPNSVTAIGKAAFYSCSSLTSVTIPNSVTNIGDYAFNRCTNLSSVTIPNSVTSLGIYSFCYSTNLTYITIPNSVTSIGEGAFLGCSGLTSVTIGNSVTNIGEWAFDACTGLTSVTIPNSVTSIGKGAFYSCSGLTSVTIGNSVTSIGERAFQACTGLTSVTIPNSVTNIGDYLFYGCSSLTSVTIPNSVTNIGDYAFNRCTNLSSVTIPNSVTSLGIYSFCYSTNLTYITIPNSVTSIGKGAFYGCSGLTSVTIGKSVTSIGDYAFYDCYNLSSIICKATTPPVSGRSILGRVPDDMQIFVPCNSVGAYSINPWNNYAIIDSVVYELNVLPLNYGTGSVQIVQSPDCETPAIIYAYPVNGYYFDQWSDGVMDNPRSIVLTQDTTIMVVFATNDSCQITTSHTGNGTTQGDTTAMYQDSVTLTAVADYGYEFSRWEDGNTDNPRVVVAIMDKDYKAIFVKRSFTIIGVGQNGTIEGAGTFEYETSCQLTATPNFGYHFAQWSDGVTDNPRSIILTQDTTFTAEFAKNAYSISLSHEGAGSIVGDTTALYQDSVTLSAVADYGWQFSRWSDGNTDNPRTIVVTADCAYQVIFIKRSFTITGVAQNGTIEGAGTFEYETSCQLTATPNFGYHFAQWSDGVTDNPRSIILTQDTTFTAEFAKNAYSISLSHEGAGSIVGDTTALYQDSVTLSAVADYGWQFSRWSDGNTDNPRTIVVTADCAYQVIFIKRSFTITGVAQNGTIEGAGTFEYETSCQLTATPNFGYHFAQWSDGVTDNPRSIILTQDTTLTAEFAMNYAGQCGDSLYWKYDTATISITGSGAMYNYTDSLMPWYLFRDSITAVEMVNTATTIGDNAFANCSKLSKLTISEGIESIGANAFMGCTQLTNITCHPIIPPYAVTSSFENYDTYLRVPCSSKSQYMADAVWGQFKYIECIEEETDIESVESESSEQSVRKIYRDGHIYILRDDEEYSILGQKL